jgi:hypothetical protein
MAFKAKLALLQASSGLCLGGKQQLVLRAGLAVLCAMHVYVLHCGPARGLQLQETSTCLLHDARRQAGVDGVLTSATSL